MSAAHSAKFARTDFTRPVSLRQDPSMSESSARRTESCCVLLSWHSIWTPGLKLLQ
jgi:hypothetical protein